LLPSRKKEKTEENCKSAVAVAWYYTKILKYDNKSTEIQETTPAQMPSPVADVFVNHHCKNHQQYIQLEE
jgi:hypothetical protein